MPALKNARHEKFCTLYPGGKAKGLSAGMIYRQSGFACQSAHASDVAASRLLQRPDILERLAELGAPAAKKANIDAKNLLDKFEHVYQKAKDNDQTLGHANRAAELQARMTGELVDRSRIEATFAFADLNSVDDVARSMLCDCETVADAIALVDALREALVRVAADGADDVTPSANNAPARARIDEAARAIELFHPDKR